ncbi:hypothetical protein CVA01_11980 [Corynebacterium variabile]|uniref:Uncharacterized protein n=1 Tax=Corynebacterium variabile TaxID=1727 RepID=A0A4Y4C377_9CORY|nr:hypothetical protein CVA01_11980 [Corynebacterium variabile]
MIHLGDRDVELPADLRDERAHHRALLFEGMHIPEENIEFTGSDPHMSGKASAPGPPATDPRQQTPDRRTYAGNRGFIRPDPTGTSAGSSPSDT